MDRSRLAGFINQKLSDLPLEPAATVSPADSVRTALARMRDGARSCVLAMEDGNLAGIFTERDVLMKCMADGFDWDQPLGAAVLTRSPKTVSADATVGEAIAILQQHHYRTLPVVDRGRVTGLVRVGDLLTHLAEAFPEEVLNLPPRPHQVMDKEEGG